jgi:hypothetical protein
LVITGRLLREKNEHVLGVLIAIDVAVVLTITTLAVGLRSLSIAQHEKRQEEADARDRFPSRPPLA